MKLRTIKLITLALITVLFANCKRSVSRYNVELEVPVSVTELTPKTIEAFINTTGTVYPLQEVTLATEMAGDYKLQKNRANGELYALGDKVEAGDVIIKIDDEEYRNSIRIKSRELDLDISKQEYDKQKVLYEKGGVTLRELKNAEIKYINTQYDIENARLNLAKMSIEAPFNGVIAELPYFTQGTKVKNATEVLRIVNYEELFLEANLPEKYYADVKEQMEVYITNYNVKEDTLKGIITQKAPAIDPDARTFKTFITIENPEGKLLPGMFVKADLVAKRREDVVVIPKELIRGRGRSQSVFIADKGYAEERRITTGIENNDYVEVVNGLSIGDRLITRGYETLRDKSKLKIIE